MNASEPQDAPARSVETRDSINGGETKPERGPESPEQSQKDDHTSLDTMDDDAGGESSDAQAKVSANRAKQHGEEAESEAETLIDSPVKKKVAGKRSTPVKTEVVDGGNATSATATKYTELDEDADAPGSPEDEGFAASVTRSSKAKASAEAMDVDSDKDDISSNSLSEISPGRESASVSSSRASSMSRAVSERPGSARQEPDSPNPRKRKHRASSVSLPNKRQSMEAPRRRLRGAHEDNGSAGGNERSPTPKLHSHRRAASTQSFLDGTADAQSGRKRRSATNLPVRDPKSARPGWDESSVSSETTSYGQNEQKRPQRGVGRSTSTPGRPVGREHKRHVNKYGFTRLAEACENGDLDLVKEWREKDPDQLELAEFAGNKPLQIAALNGNAEIVEYLIDQGCQVDCANVDKDTPLIDASENGHVEVVEILLKAGVDPLRQNLKGQQALDVITDDTDNVAQIRAVLRNAIEKWNSDDAKQRREEEEEQRYRAGPAKELHFMARTYENLVRLVTDNDRNGVREFLDARVPVDNAVIAAAARTGDLYLMNMLLAEMTDKKRHQKAEKPMLNVLGTSHFEMVKSLTELEQFNPLWTNRQGKRWSEIAEEKAGPMMRQEVDLFKRLERDAEERGKDRLSSSPVMRRSDAPSKQKRFGAPKDDYVSEDDMDDGAQRQRKNGRRLMSRKDMRVASSKKPEKDSGASDSETADASGSNRRPAPSPKEKRGPGRPRTKSLITAKAEEMRDKGMKKQDRRSSLANPTAEPDLPSVAERGDEEGMDIDEPNVSPRDHVEQEEQERIAEKERDAEERRRKQEEDERLKAEEEAKQEKERQLAEEEAARQEQERQREAELEAARSKAREELLHSLPSALSWMLDPKSDFSYDERGAIDTILEHFAPLQIVRHVNTSSRMHAEMDQTQHWVLNVQVAPFLGKDAGLQLLLPLDSPAFHRSLSQDLPGIALTEDEKRSVVLLCRDTLFANNESVEQDERMVDDEKPSFGEELDLAIARFRSGQDVGTKLLEASLSLRWIPLESFIREMHPALKTTDIAIREDWQKALPRTKPDPSKPPQDADFFTKVKLHWQQSPGIASCRFGQGIEPSASTQCAGSTAVAITHEK